MMSYVFFIHVFPVTRHQIVLVVLVAKLVYTYLTRRIEDCLEIGGSGSAIYLAYLVLRMVRGECHLFIGTRSLV